MDGYLRLPPSSTVTTRNGIHRSIFRRASATYFNASLFFPKRQRSDVFSLYVFVRRADTFVDSIPQQPERFFDFHARYLRALLEGAIDDPVIDAFVELQHRLDFRQEWIDAFFASMESDLSNPSYTTLEETLRYIYGSAEVIGLCMARIMELPTQANPPARMLGRTMQYINYLRDIAEDNELGRCYLPLNESALPDLSEQTCRAAPEEFRRFMLTQIERYRGWRAEALTGFHYLGRRFLIPIKTALDMYDWTARMIERDCFSVFHRKIKPSRHRVLSQALVNGIIISCSLYG